MDGGVFRHLQVICSLEKWVLVVQGSAPGSRGVILRGSVWTGYLKLCSHLPGKAMDPTASKHMMGEQGKGPNYLGGLYFLDLLNL